MANINNHNNIQNLIQKSSSPLLNKDKSLSIILAAGHGKRIKSSRSKMLHMVWGVPTVVRVCRAAREGLNSPDQIVVVGIKAREVVSNLGARGGRRFVWQEKQLGTGHALKVAIDSFDDHDLERDIYIFPGDMGLMDYETVKAFKKQFKESNAQMIVMIGIFTGHYEKNYYGRIIRVPEKDVEGNFSGDDYEHIIQIMENRDILALPPDKPYQVEFNKRKYSFSRQRLLEIKEFNAGVYAFKGKYLKENLARIKSDNAQGEIYLTDLIFLFNQNNLTVKGAEAYHKEAVIGFNDRAVLNQMQLIARNNVYDKINKIVTIWDKNNFFIADEVVNQILEMDKKGSPLDITIGQGAYLGPGVKLNQGVYIEKNAYLVGNIILDAGVYIGESVYMSTYDNQKIVIGGHTEILKGDILKGNIVIGNNCRIETPVRLTGSDKFPLTIGQNVRIKGTTYIFGSTIEDCVYIVNCVLIKKQIKCRKNKAGKSLPICYIHPPPEGEECLKDL